LSYNRWLRIAWEQAGLPVLAQRLGAHVLVSATNHGPRFPRCPQVVCLFNALYYSEEYWRLLAGNRAAQWSLALQRALVGLAVAGSRVVVVQQPGMIALARRFFPGVPASRFRLMPNAAPPAPPPAPARLRERLPGRIIINGIAHYNPHRNLEVLLGAMERLTQAGRRDLALVVAAGSADHRPDSERFVEQARRIGREGAIINLGRRLTLAETYGALRESDIMVYPSLAESFSAAYLMAMECGVPLVAADLDFARTICSDAAAYFRYDSPDDLGRRLVELADDPDRQAELVQRGHERCRAYTWDRMLAGFLGAIDAALD
jgi:glycosyltransferase involved in cell wall biosynthesis